MDEIQPKTEIETHVEWNTFVNLSESVNNSRTFLNASEELELPPLNLDVFYQPDWLIISMYVAVLTASLAANTLLIFIVIKFQYMRSVTNIFLVNLSAADLLVTLFCMPVQIAKSVTLLWHFGEVMCKTINTLQGVAVASSVFTITAMSVDRYLAITQSLRQPWLPSRRGAVMLLAAIWLAAMAIFAPLLAVAAVQRVQLPHGGYFSMAEDTQSSWLDGVGLPNHPDSFVSLTHRKYIVNTCGANYAAGNLTMVSFTSEENSRVEYIEFCTEIWPDSVKKELFGSFSFALVYAVPGCIVVVSYALMGRRLCSVIPPFDLVEGSVNNQQRLRLIQERKRVAWILLLLAVLFAFCWFPYNIIQLLLDFNAVGPKHVALALPYTLLLGHMNSAINPIVYCLMTRNFRRSLRKLLCREPDQVASTTHIQMKGLRHKCNASSIRTRTSGNCRSSLQGTGTTSLPPGQSIKSRVSRSSLRASTRNEGDHAAHQFL